MNLIYKIINFRVFYYFFFVSWRRQKVNVIDYSSRVELQNIDGRFNLIIREVGLFILNLKEIDRRYSFNIFFFILECFCVLLNRFVYKRWNDDFYN